MGGIEVGPNEIRILNRDWRDKEQETIVKASLAAQEVVKKLVAENLPKLRAIGLLHGDLKATMDCRLDFDFAPKHSKVVAIAEIDFGTVIDKKELKITTAESVKPVRGQKKCNSGKQR